MQDLNFRSLPSVAVTDGATAPVPADGCAWAWSTAIAAPVYWTGSSWRTLTGGPSLDRLSWKIVSTNAFCTLIPAALELVNEPFTADTGQFTYDTEGTLPTITWSGGQVTVSSSGGAEKNVIARTGADLTMPQCGVQIDWVSRSAIPGWENVGIGIAKDANNYIFALRSQAGSAIGIQYRIGGGSIMWLPGSSVSGSVPVKLGFSMIGNSFCAWLDAGAGWVCRMAYTIPTGTINFETAALTGWRPAYKVTIPASSAIDYVFDNMIAGRFGGFGIRDCTLVTEEDGTPYVAGGYAYFTATSSDGNGASYQSVQRLDLTSNEVAQTAAIMCLRDGAKKPDFTGQIIRYANGDCRLLTSTLGDGTGAAYKILQKLFAATDLLNGSHLLSLDTTADRLTLPQQAEGGGTACAFAPCLVKVAGTWSLAYTVSWDPTFANNPVWSALASSTDLSTWTAVADDRTMTGYEGAKWVKDGAKYFITAGTRGQARIYDDKMNFRGLVRATFNGGTVTNPHAMIFFAEGKWRMLSSDQVKPSNVGASNTWGRLIIQEPVN